MAGKIVMGYVSCDIRCFFRVWHGIHLQQPASCYPSVREVVLQIHKIAEVEPRLTTQTTGWRSRLLMRFRSVMHRNDAFTRIVTLWNSVLYYSVQLERVFAAVLFWRLRLPLSA